MVEPSEIRPSGPGAAAATLDGDWILPTRGRVGIAGMIIAEVALFIIFVVAYLYYLGKSLSGPTPKEVLDLPIVNTICLLSSSATIMFAIRALRRGAMGTFNLWWLLTIILALVFLVGTGQEWYRLIYTAGLTIRTNLFGTTFYSLVGLHAFHVIVGVLLLTTVMIIAARGSLHRAHAEHTEVLSLYWHFVDAVWIVVFTVVYVIGR